MEVSTVIAIAALAVSVLSPTLTTVLNNWHESRMYNRRYYNEHRAEVIEGFIRSGGAFLKEATSENTAEYGRYFGEIFMYAPQSMWEKIIAFENTPFERGDIKFELFTELCTELASQPPRSPRKKKHRRNINN